MVVVFDIKLQYDSWHNSDEVTIVNIDISILCTLCDRTKSVAVQHEYTRPFCVYFSVKPNVAICLLSFCCHIIRTFTSFWNRTFGTFWNCRLSQSAKSSLMPLLPYQPLLHVKLYVVISRAHRLNHFSLLTFND